MVLIDTPLSIIPVVTGVAGMVAANLTVLLVPLPKAGMVSLTTEGAAAGMAAVVAAAPPVVVIGSPGSREAPLHPIVADLRPIGTARHPIAGEDSVKVILTV